MRRLADDLVLSLKDQIRTIRYSLRSEADTPGSVLPEAYRGMEFGPLGTVRTVLGTPVLRMADDLFTQVEHVTLGLLDPAAEQAPFPRPVTNYFGRGDERVFTHDFYRETKSLLARYGARHMLVSEHTVDDLKKELVARHRDLIHSALGRNRGAAEGTTAVVRVCAAIAVGYARLRPIQRVDVTGSAMAPRHLMLAPNLYVGLVLALAVALLTTRREARNLDSGELIESADAVVDARFDRLKTAIDGRDPVLALGREFEAVLPFLP